MVGFYYNLFSSYCFLVVNKHMLFNKFILSFFAAQVITAAVPEGHHHDGHHHGHDHGHDDHDHHHEDDESSQQYTSEMMEKQARADFDSMDTDADGFLARDEIISYLNDPSAESEVDEFFNNSDKNNDELVSFEEYFFFVMALYDKYMQDAANAPHNMEGGDEFDMEQLEEMMRQMGGSDDNWDDDDDDEEVVVVEEEQVDEEL